MPGVARGISKTFWKNLNEKKSSLKVEYKKNYFKFISANVYIYLWAKRVIIKIKLSVRYTVYNISYITSYLLFMLNYEMYD